MFFENDCPLLKLRNIYSFSQQNVRRANCLDYSSLSFRYGDSETEFLSKTETYSLQFGAIAYVPKALPYVRKSRIDNVIVFNFDTDLSCDSIEVFYPKNVAEYHALFHQALTLWEQKPLGYAAECTSILYKILSVILRDRPNEDKTPPLLSRALSEIHSRIGDPTLAVGDLAKAQYVSEVYLRKLFHKYLHMSPKEYIVDTRMKRAATLIDSAELSVAEIAEKCGYSGSAYFYSAFMQYYGTSPSDFRRQNKKLRPSDTEKL